MGHFYSTATCDLAVRAEGASLSVVYWQGAAGQSGHVSCSLECLGAPWRMWPHYLVNRQGLIATLESTDNMHCLRVFFKYSGTMTGMSRLSAFSGARQFLE